MDKKSYIIRLQSWARIIMEANNSGMAKTKWCQLHDIKLRRFYYWQKKIRDYLQEHPEASLTGWQTPDSVCENTDEQQEFYEISVAQETAPAPACDVVRTSNTSHPANSISRPVSPSTVSRHPSANPPLMLQYDRFQLFIDDGISENTLSSVIRVIKNV